MHKQSEFDALPRGAYETPIDARLHQRITATLAEGLDVSVVDANGEFSDRYISAVIRGLSARLEEKLLKTKSAEEKVGIINQLAALSNDEAASVENLALLASVHEKTPTAPPSLPQVSFHEPALLTNTNGDPSLVHELTREIETADSVDLLCAFVRVSGVTVLDAALQSLKERGVPFRIITSTYCGATEAAALDRLAKRYGAEIRVCFESSSTRLHAKAWMFKRNSGLDTAYIGSSNLSKSAVVDGWEWNVKVSRSATPSVLDKFTASFDSYWEDPQFRPYTPDQHEELNRALKLARGVSDETPVQLSGLRVEPYPYQRVMLEALDAERTVHDRHKNLLVAATGTGKTVVAALDYRGLCEQADSQPSLLFIAHRKEILKQSLRTFREVLADPNFGELLVGNEKPKQWKHVFASIQSLNNNADLQNLSPEHFQVVIVDEFHHAAASTYSRLLEWLKPQELLGLTATPERADGASILHYFDYRTAYELRLWDAMRLQLLVPMHYFGINDETDLSHVAVKRGDYDISNLSKALIEAGDKRTRLILQQLERYVADLRDLKAFGFCVDVNHARFMAESFRTHGLAAESIDGSTNPSEREAAIHKLRTGEIKVLFSVEVFNEGVDVPEVNTVLLLRPTKSATIFLQQIGRGLRLSKTKDACTVLDFIGQQSKDFDIHTRYAALTGFRGKRLENEIEADFPDVPPGTSISLDRVSSERVLQSAKRFTYNRNQITKLVAQSSQTSMVEFLLETGLPIDSLYTSKGMSWSHYLGASGRTPNTDFTKEEDFLLAQARSLLHVTDPVRAEQYFKIAAGTWKSYSDMPSREKAFARMLYGHLWATAGKPVAFTPGSIDAALELFSQYPRFASEIQELMFFQTQQSRTRFTPIKGDLGSGALFAHAEYTRGEMVGAMAPEDSPEKSLQLFREGVKHFPEHNTDLLFVTLDKEGDKFTPTTRYHDYPISPSRFHWESQSTTTLSSKTGQRYLNHVELGGRILLFVREQPKNQFGLGTAFTLLGEANYHQHRGERPIQIEWDLVVPMPLELFERSKLIT